MLPLVLGCNRGLSLTLLSIILQPLVLLYPPHKLVRVLKRLHSQSLFQLGFLRVPQSKSARSHLLVASSNLVIQLLVPVCVGSESLPTPHPHI